MLQGLRKIFDAVVATEVSKGPQRWLWWLPDKQTFVVATMVD